MARGRPARQDPPSNAWPRCDAGSLSDRLAGEGWTLVEYWAADNLFCRLLAPLRAALPLSHGTRLRLLCCVLDEPGGGPAFGPDAVPALILFHGKRRVRSWLGAIDASLLRYHIDNALAAGPPKTGPLVDAAA
jgi:hypothetical protein